MIMARYFGVKIQEFSLSGQMIAGIVYLMSVLFKTIKLESNAPNKFDQDQFWFVYG